MAVVLVHAADHLTVEVDERFFLPIMRELSHKSLETPPFEFDRHEFVARHEWAAFWGSIIRFILAKSGWAKRW